MDVTPRGAGSNLVDFSGRGNHFNFVSPVPQHVGSARGHAIQIVSSGYAALEPNPNVAGLREMTVLAWVRDDAANPTANEHTISHGGQSGSQQSWRMARAAFSNTLFVNLSSNGTSAQKSFNTAAPFTPFDGQWHQIGFTFDGRTSSNGVLDLWMDGRRVNVFTGTPTDGAMTVLHNSTNQLRIGIAGDAGGPAPGHEVQSVKMWNRALSGREILRDFAETFIPSV